MDNDDLKVLILAAGLGKRMYSPLPKGLCVAAGRTMLERIVDAARSLTDDIICVVGHGREQVAETLRRSYSEQCAFDESQDKLAPIRINGGSIEFAVQEEQRGTGHAAKMAEHLFDSGNVLVLFADTPLITGDLLKNLLDEHRTSKNSATLITAELDEPGALGRIVRKDGVFEKIVEYKNASEAEKNIKEINSGIAVFDAKLLKEKLSLLTDDNAQGEYLLTDVFEMLVADGRRIGALMARDADEVLGVNDQYMLAAAEQAIIARKRRALMMSGVVMHMPESIYIEDDVAVEPGAIIEQGTRLFGNTYIKSGAVVGPFTELRNVEIGSGTVIERTVAMDSKIGENCKIGPFAYIRPDTYLADKVKVGDFVELKNARVGIGTKIPHLSYIGDGEIGERTNIGCGTIFVNYDGMHKHRTKVGSDSFIGCNSNLVAPVSVGDDTFVAAGTTVTRDVADGEFVVSRVPQTTKPNKNKK